MIRTNGVSISSISIIIIIMVKLHTAILGIILIWAVWAVSRKHSVLPNSLTCLRGSQGPNINKLPILSRLRFSFGFKVQDEGKLRDEMYQTLNPQI